MYHHVPVLLEEVVSCARSVGARGSFIDVTLGGGAYSEALLEALPGFVGLGMDRDPEAVEASRIRLGRFGDRFRIVHDKFSNIGKWAALLDSAPLFIVADLGISSHQIDVGYRGFSLTHEGPLDMRMDGEEGGESAEGLIRRLSVGELAEVLREYGDVPRSMEIAKRVKDGVCSGAISTTVQLADMLRFGFARGKTGPVAQVFQALRIAVNGEMEELDRLLEASVPVLGVGGRLAMVTFHSLEERAVKRAFKGYAAGGSYCVVADRLTASEAELCANVRARSAALRCLERLS